MTKSNRLAQLEAELEKAELEHARAAQDTWETSSTALEAKCRVYDLRDEIDKERRRIEDEAQGRLW